MVLTALSDGELIELCRRKNKAAWETLVTRYERLVYAVPRRFGLDSAECDDVFQSTWLALLKELKNLKHSEALSSWLTVTAKRESWRVRWNKEHKHTDSADINELPDEIFIDHTTPDHLLEEHQQIAHLHDAVNGLGERCRQLLQLLYLNPVPSSYDEISQILGMPVGAIGPNRARCLEKLRQLV